MSQRRLDGVRQTTPKPDKPAPTCDDCGTPEFEDMDLGPERWEDGQVLREYSDGGYGCKPCSNGEREPQTGGPVSPLTQGILDVMEEFAPKCDFIADKVFPVVKEDYDE